MAIWSDRVVETLKVQLSKEKAQQVREVAMKQFGYSKGSISKASNAALDDWVQKQERSKKQPKPNWKSVRGALREIKMGSVELQHAAFFLKQKP